MARTDFNTTTLTNALNASDRDFAVGSTANITAGTSILIIEGEAMLVQAIPVSGRVQVMRGWKGTRAQAHPALALVTIASGADLDGRHADGFLQLTDSTGSLPPYPALIGARRRDAQGNEYVFCAFGEALYGRQAVVISDAFVATKLGTTGRGRVGVVAETNGGTSDQAGWVQIYGRCFVQLLGATAEVSPSDAANGPTTLSTTAQTKFWLPTTATSVATVPEGIRWTSGNASTASGFIIRGITVASDASPGDVSVVTAATSHTGSQIAVFLNYPEVAHINVGE